MKKYCIAVEKVIVKSEKIIVYADSTDKAISKANEACESGTVNFNDNIGEYEFYDCRMDSDTSLNDDTFDEEQYSDYGMQIIY